MGGIIAGRMLAKRVLDGSGMESYQKEWSAIFGDEFSRQILARKILVTLDNPTLEKLLKTVTPEMVKSVSEKDDFDFHTATIVRLLGVKGAAKVAGAVLGGKMRGILDKV